MSTQIQIRRDTEANWTSVNPILADGEIGFDLTNNRFKVGNGVDAWNDIEFSGSAVATEEQPNDPGKGDQWFDPSTGNLLIWNGSDWVVVGGGDTNIPIIDTPPEDPELGEQWFSSTDGYLYIWYGAEWVAIGGAGGGDGGGSGGDGGDPDYGDPHWSDVALLINCDGENDGSQNFIDASNNHSILVWNGASVTTSLSKYGTGSINLNEAQNPDGFLEIPRSTKLDLTKPFTIEFWAYVASGLDTGVLIANWHGSGNFCFTLTAMSDRSLSCSLSDNGSTNRATLTSRADSLPIAPQEWAHIALCWTGTNYLLFVDGALEDSLSASWPLHPLEKSWTIGRRYSSAGGEGVGGTNTQPFTGWIDDIRVTIGTCRYDGSFTPPDKHPAPVALKKPLVMTSDPVETQEDSNDADLS